jgi:hypothetical protein
MYLANSKEETGVRMCKTWEIHNGTECYISSMNISDRGYFYFIRRKNGYNRIKLARYKWE